MYIVIEFRSFQEKPIPAEILRKSGPGIRFDGLNELRGPPLQDKLKNINLVVCFDGEWLYLEAPHDIRF